MHGQHGTVYSLQGINMVLTLIFTVYICTDTKYCQAIERKGAKRKDEKMPGSKKKKK